MTQPAFYDPYADPNLTFRGPFGERELPTTPPSLDAATHLAPDKSYEENVVENPDNAHVTAVPPAHDRWVPGYDPYANEGTPEDSFFQQQSET